MATVFSSESLRLVESSPFQTIRDSFARGGFPAFRRERPAFDTNHPADQLVALERACRNSFYQRAVAESLVETDRFDEITNALADTGTSNAALGALVRAISLEYVEACAEQRGDDMRDFL